MLLSVQDAEGNFIWYGYDDLWRRIWVVDGRGTGPEDENYKTRYFYDAADRLIRTEGPPLPDAPDGITRWFGYDEIGNREWATNGNGSAPQDSSHTTRYEYDNNSNLTEVHQPLGRITRYAYDGLDRKWKAADANGSLTSQYTEYTYDPGSRLTQVRDPENNVSSFTHDAHGNVLTATDPSGVTVTYEYDSLHRRTLKKDELNNAWHTEYDVLGRVARTIDATDHPTQYTYDALGRLTAVLDAADGTTQYTYDNNGNLLQILDANGHAVSKRQYDANNRLIRAEDGNGNYYTYGYDAVSNQTSVRDANDQPAGGMTILTYDAENRRMTISYPDGTSVTYTYDNNGNRTSMIDVNGASSYGYDELNRLVSSVDSYGQRVDYEYDSVGNRIRLTYPGLHPGDPGKLLQYGYDKANRLTSITDWAARATQYSYTGLRIETVTFPNGVVETHGYDDGGRLTGLNSTHAASTVVGFEWTRDGVGAPLTATETNTLSPVIPTRAVSYAYDSDNRLTESSRGTYEDDANGNLTSRTIDGVTTDFEYDDEDRLVAQIRDPDGAAIRVDHIYDGDGNRIARTDDTGTVRYVLDRGVPLSNVLCETDTAGNVTAYYIHGSTLIARIDVAGEARYYHTNDLGNVVALTDSTGAVTDRYAYEPYGLPVGHEGTTPNPFTFVGSLGVMTEDFDDPMGLYFMRARFYDPDTGRFLGKDPVEGVLTNPLGLNRYVYGRDNPLVYNDPSGEVINLVTGAIGAGFGFFGTVVSDVISGEWSDPAVYAANTLGGFVGGVTLNPAIGVAVASATAAATNVYEQVSEGRSLEEVDWGSVAVDAVVSGTISYASGGVGKGLVRAVGGHAPTKFTSQLMRPVGQSIAKQNVVGGLFGLGVGALSDTSKKTASSQNHGCGGGTPKAKSGGGGSSKASSADGKKNPVSHAQAVHKKIMQKIRFMQMRARMMRMLRGW